ESPREPLIVLTWVGTLDSALAELRKIQRFAFAEPHDMGGVIGKVVTAVAVREDGETATMGEQPFKRGLQLFTRDGQLARTARVRTDRPDVQPAHCDAER